MTNFAERRGGVARQRVSSLVTEPGLVISCQFAPASRHYEARARSKTVLKALSPAFIIIPPFKFLNAWMGTPLFHDKLNLGSF